MTALLAMNLYLRVAQYTLSVVLFCIRKLEEAPDKYLVALGCASWTAGQLEQEIADNAWLVAPASDTILFETIYEDRYPAANQLLGINPHNFVFSQVGHS